MAVLPDPMIDPEALAIAEGLLAKTAVAFKRRDAALFARCIALPHRLSTFGQTVVIEDIEGLNQTFYKVCDEFAKLGVTDLARQCIAARFRDPDTIAQTHISHVMAGQRRVKDPYPCFAILKRHEGVWRVQSSDYALEGHTSHAQALTWVSHPVREMPPPPLGPPGSSGPGGEPRP